MSLTGPHNYLEPGAKNQNKYKMHFGLHKDKREGLVMARENYLIWSIEVKNTFFERLQSKSTDPFMIHLLLFVEAIFS